MYSLTPFGKAIEIVEIAPYCCSKPNDSGSVVLSGW